MHTSKQGKNGERGCVGTEREGLAQLVTVVSPGGILLPITPELDFHIGITSSGRGRGCFHLYESREGRLYHWRGVTAA